MVGRFTSLRVSILGRDSDYQLRSSLSMKSNRPGRHKLEQLPNATPPRSRAKSVTATTCSLGRRALRKTCTVIRKIGGARRKRIGFSFHKSLLEEFPQKNGERDENEEQNQWLYHSQRRVRCVSVGGLYRG